MNPIKTESDAVRGLLVSRWSNSATRTLLGRCVNFTETWATRFRVNAPRTRRTTRPSFPSPCRATCTETAPSSHTTRTRTESNHAGASGESIILDLRVTSVPKLPESIILQRKRGISVARNDKHFSERLGHTPPLVPEILQDSTDIFNSAVWYRGCLQKFLVLFLILLPGLCRS